MTGQTIKHYEVVSKIGEGGMGDVYKAYDQKLDRYVALKFLPPHLSRDETGKKRFIHEAKSISKHDHPNICTVYEIGETDDGRFYIAMAYYNGRALDQVIDERGLPVNDVVDIALKIARGLSSVHEHDILHRDIKPANIIITDEGQVKIIDFGLAKLVGHTTLTKEGSTLGTIAYMSPEQTEGDVVDHRSDIWALGVVLYEMLTGRRPFRGEYEQAIIYSIINEAPERPARINKEIPPILEEIALKCLKKNPDERYGSIDDVIHDFEQFQNANRKDEIGSISLTSLKRTIRKPRVLFIAAVFVSILIFATLWFAERRSHIRWAESEALPQIEFLVESNWSDYTDAYELASEAREYIPDNKTLTELLDKITLNVSFTTQPEGARVYMKEYDAPDSPWERVGTTPIKGTPLPVGIFRFKFTKEEYEEVQAVSSTWNIGPIGSDDPLLQPNSIFRKLDKKGELPSGMVRVLETETPDGIIPEFLIDKYEVTNNAFKAFLNDGGYSDQSYWKHPFVNNGDTLSFEDAMAFFIDRTGRPGPSGWEAGDYTEGKDGFPVNGISWYEAAAYAEYAGKSLLTKWHWDAARGNYTPLLKFPQLGGLGVFAPYSNFGSKEEGPVETGSLPGITPYGAFDMAGNVREWAWNDTPNGKLLRGGAWNDNPYAFGNLGQAPAFDRSEKNGFRCALYPDRNRIPKTFFENVNFPEPPNFYEMDPVSNEVFQVYKQQFAYDMTALQVEALSRKEREDWVFERVSFEAPYGDERIIANLFLPKNTEPPYQTVIYFPGSASLMQSSSENLESYYEFPVFLSFLVKNGRAVVYPVFKGTFERQDKSVLPIFIGADTYEYTDYAIKLVKDFKRTVDYLETREDINSDKLAYLGMSWGGVLGAIIPAVEDRLKASVLVPGAMMGKGRPEVNQVNYVGRVTIPTLMLNGKYDTLAPLETAIKPMYELLGTPNEHKKLILYETDHIPPKTEFMKETLNWYDKYLGPVK